jgi:hypothetical protein
VLVAVVCVAAGVSTQVYQVSLDNSTSYSPPADDKYAPDQGRQNFYPPPLRGAQYVIIQRSFLQCIVALQRFNFAGFKERPVGGGVLSPPPVYPVSGCC